MKVTQAEYSTITFRLVKNKTEYYDNIGNLIVSYIGKTGRVLGFTENYQTFYLI